MPVPGEVAGAESAERHLWVFSRRAACGIRPTNSTLHVVQIVPRQGLFGWRWIRSSRAMAVVRRPIAKTPEMRQGNLGAQGEFRRIELTRRPGNDLFATVVMVDVIENSSLTDHSRFFNEPRTRLTSSTAFDRNLQCLFFTSGWAHRTRALNWLLVCNPGQFVRMSSGSECSIA